MLALSWVQYGSGYRSDLRLLGEACRESGVLFVVDAIQGLGALRLDVERELIDVLAAGSHKLASRAGGPGHSLRLGESRAAVGAPPASGWRSVADIDDWSKFDLTLGPGAKRFECGTLNVYAIDALGVSIAMLEAIGETLEPTVLALAERGRSGARRARFSRSSAGGCAPGSSARPTRTPIPRASPRRLAERGVVVAERLGRLRISPHVYNTEADIGRCLDEIDRVLTSS